MTDDKKNLPARGPQLPAVVDHGGPPVATSTAVTLRPSSDVAEPTTDEAEAPKALPPQRDPDLMTIDEARKAIIRVRRYGFYLYVRVPTYSDDEPGYFRAAYQYMPVSAKQLLDLLRHMERGWKADRMVKVKLKPDDERDRWNNGIMFFGG